MGLAYPGISVLDPVAGPAPALVGVALIFHSLRTSSSGLVALFAGWIAGSAHFVVALHWMAYPFTIKAESHLWALPFAAVLVPSGLGLFWAFAFFISRKIAPGRGFLLAVAFATALALAEWLRGTILTGFPWAMPGHVWIGTEARSIYPAVGAYTATFLTLLAPAFLIAGIPSDTQGVRAAIRLVSGVALTALVAAGAYTLAERLVAGDFIPVVDTESGPLLQLVQPNIPQREKWSQSHRSRNLERLLSLSEPVQGQKADIVIWPESALPMVLERERLREDGQGLSTVFAQRAGSDTTLILGALTKNQDEEFFNSLVILHGSEGFLGIYDKHHLVPFGEYVPLKKIVAFLGFDALTGGGFERGQGPMLMTTRHAPAFVPAICYEIIFPREISKALKQGSWILQLTNDAWFGPDAGPRQHFALAQIRAAEFGVPLVRVANTGITGIVDSAGRVLETLPVGEAGAFLYRLPANPPGITLYAFWGDSVLFVLLAAGTAVIVTGRLFLRISGRQRRTSPG